MIALTYPAKRQIFRRTEIVLLNVILPLLLGGLIYISFRTTSLKMFSWFKLLGIDDLVFEIRAFLQSGKQYIPKWVFYSLPSGLWVYAFTSSMLLVWRKSDKIMKYFFISIGGVLAIGGEVGQLANIVPGTFAESDLLLCILFLILSVIFLGIRKV